MTPNQERKETEGIAPVEDNQDFGMDGECVVCERAQEIVKEQRRARVKSAAAEKKSNDTCGICVSAGPRIRIARARGD